MDYFYHQIYYKPIGIDLSRQRNISVSQFLFKLEEGNGVPIFFIAENQQKTTLSFSLDSLNSKNNINNGASNNIKKY